MEQRGLQAATKYGRTNKTEGRRNWRNIIPGVSFREQMLLEDVIARLGRVEATLQDVLVRLTRLEAPQVR